MVTQRPAAFGRLRVETEPSYNTPSMWKPAAFGRLRVETLMATVLFGDYIPAAFGRLRVETRSVSDGWGVPFQPPSGGCVLKLLISVFSVGI